ncbi:MAG: hypothetical protein E7263_09700 [Lachnospiraceae bacterium]|nr:hypothetical protein [Lachnospiraceae bacterium]
MRKIKSNIILVLVLILMLSLLGCSKDDKKDKDDKKQTVSEKDATDDKKDKEDKKEDKTTAATTEDVAEPAFEEYYLVDYAVFMKYLVEDTTYGDHSRNLDLVAGCQVFDSDGDGRKELYAQISSNGISGNCYVISPSTKAGIYINSQTGAAGECEFSYSSVENQIYYRAGYSTVGILTADYCRYNGNNGMNLEMSYLQTFDTADAPGSYMEEANWKGDVKTQTRAEGEASLYDEWYGKINSLNLTPIDNNYKSITKVVSTDSIDNAIKGMEKHLSSIGVKYLTTAVDLDGNGTKEQVYAIENYCTKWMSNTNAENSFNNQMFYDVTPTGVVYIILDGNDNETNIYVDILYDTFEISKIEDNNGLSVTGAYEFNIIYDVYEPGEEYVLGYDIATYQDNVNSEENDSLINRLLTHNYYTVSPQDTIIMEYTFNSDCTYIICEYAENSDGLVMNNSWTGIFSIDEATNQVFFDGDTTGLTYNQEYECLMTDIVYVEPDPQYPEFGGGYRGTVLVEKEIHGCPSYIWLAERKNEIMEACK